MSNFTFDEINLMCIYNTGIRAGLMQAPTDMRGQLEPDEDELLELAQAVQREDEEKHRAQQPVRREKSSEKPSILAKLKALPVADTKSVKSAPKRSAEREL